MGEAGEGDGVDTKEVKAGTKCSRCTKKGHIAVNCTTEIYCVICDKHDHVNYKCPLLKMPRLVNIKDYRLMFVLISKTYLQGIFIKKSTLS
jgi:hypothetical protein